MKILNIHKRIIHQDLAQVMVLLNTLTTKNDLIWPHEKWPRIKLDNDFKIGSKGGHGPIKYFVNKYKVGELIEFQFTQPQGFYGVHRLELKELGVGKTEVKHTIDIQAKGQAILQWTFVIRWLHDALIEDAFDKIENHFDQGNRHQRWSPWVKLWRRLLNKKRK